jgi:hypothetical protein
MDEEREAVALDEREAWQELRAAVWGIESDEGLPPEAVRLRDAAQALLLLHPDEGST